MISKNKVLVISAGPEQFSAAVSRLQFAGCAVLYAQDSENGLEVARSERPGLIISELAMPNIDGLELCRRVRLDSSLSTVPVLLVGDLSESSPIVKDGLRCGANDYVIKRIDQGDLFKRCSSLIGLNDDVAPFDETEDVFRTLIENVTDIITIVAADGHILFESPSVERVIGYKPDEIIGCNSFDLIHPDDRETAIGYFKATLHSFTTSPPIEYRFLHKDGSWKYVESTGKPFNDPQHGLVVLMTTRDTTDRRNAIEARRETDGRLQAIFENAAIGMAMVTWSGHPVKSNPALQKMLGYTAEELKERSFVEFTHPDDVQKDLDLLNELFDGKKDSYQIEKRFITKRGGTVWGRLTVSAFGERSEDSHVIAMVENINDQKIARAALLESEERFRSQYEGLPIPIFTWRKQGDDFVFQGYNHAADQLTHGTMSGGIGVLASEHFKHQPGVLEAFHRCVAEQTTISLNGPYRFQLSGELKYLETNIVFIKPDIVMVACRDITEQTETERLLKESRERFELVSVATNDGLWDWDFATNSLWMNEEFHNLLGIRPDDDSALLKDNWYAAIHPDDRDRVINGVREAVENGAKYWVDEYRMKASDGSEAHFLDRGYVVYDSVGKPLRMIGAVMDISDLRRTETALQRSQQHFALAQQAARIGSFEFEFNSLKSISSPELEDLYGAERGSLNRSYEDWARFVHPDDQASAVRELARAKYTGVHESEFRIIRGDGGIRWMYSKGKVFFETNGEPSRLVGVNMDITERKLAEQDLQAGRVRLYRQNKVLNGLNMHHKLFGETLKDAVREILEISASTLDVDQVSMWLYDDDKSKIKAVDVYEKTADRHSSGLELTEADFPVFFSALRDDAAFVVSDVKSDPRTVEYAGSSFSLAGITSALSSPIRIGGEVVGMICQAHAGGPHEWTLDEQNFAASMADMISLLLEADKRKTAEAALASANQRAISEYDRLLERLADLGQQLGSARDLITIFRAVSDFAVNSVPCSALLLFLYDKEKQSRDAVHIWYDGGEIDTSELQSVPVNNGPAGQAIMTGEVIVVNDYLKRTSTSKTHIEAGYDRDSRDPRSAIMVPMKIMGKVVGVVEIQSYEINAYTQEHATAMRMAANLAANAIENVRLFEAEQARAEQLRQSQRLESVGRLAGGIAHDFNNMLTAIKGYSDLTLRKLDAEDPMRGNVEEIKKAGQRAAELTQQLLAFSRRQVMRPKVIDLNQIVSETTGMLDRLIGEDLELGLALSDELGSVQADPGQITQVIINLAVNSRDALPEGGKITIETSNIEIDDKYIARHAEEMKPGRYVMLAVSDTGIGISAEDQKHIFEPFFTTKPTGKGTGLGLATVYGIVKQSGGYIWAYSEIGQGTVVKVYLPRIDAEIDEILPNAIITTDIRGSETILLVEDEELVRNMSRQILETCGYKVVEATDGAHALSICMRPEHKFDLLLTDVVMPKMGGRQLVQNLETVRPDLRVLFMSGYTDDSIVRHGVIESGNNFIQKPFTFNSLAGKVREMLDTRKN